MESETARGTMDVSISSGELATAMAAHFHHDSAVANLETSVARFGERDKWTGLRKQAQNKQLRHLLSCLFWACLETFYCVVLESAGPPYKICVQKNQ